MMIEQHMSQPASPTGAAHHHSGEGEIMDTYNHGEHMCRIAAHSHCPNARYPWHRIDGYCKECATTRDREDSTVEIEARRNAQGYR